MNNAKNNENSIKAGFLSDLLTRAYLRRRKKYLEQTSNFPFQIDMEITNACNLRCIMCPRDNMTRPIKHMEPHLFHRIIDEVGLYGLERMDISLFGEPLMHPDFVKMAKYASERGNIKHIYTSTNGMLLDEKKAKEILLSDSLDKIIISIDGASKRTYERIRRKGNYDILVDNIKRFIILRRKMKLGRPTLAIQIIQMDETNSEIDTFVKFWSPLLDEIDQIAIKGYLTWAGKVGSRFNDNSLRFVIRTPCLTYLWSNLAIYCDGSVTTCCYDVNGEMKLGNLKDYDIKGIWNGAPLQKIRQLHLNQQFDTFLLCRNCEFTKRYIVPMELLRLIAKHGFGIGRFEHKIS